MVHRPVIDQIRGTLPPVWQFGARLKTAAVYSSCTVQESNLQPSD
jgi:hypothetical protein